MSGNSPPSKVHVSLPRGLGVLAGSSSNAVWCGTEKGQQRGTIFAWIVGLIPPSECTAESVIKLSTVYWRCITMCPGRLICFMLVFLFCGTTCIEAIKKSQWEVVLVNFERAESSRATWVSG